MKQVKYIKDDDTLKIEFAKDIEQPIVKILQNGTILEFDYDYNLLAIFFPKFFAMMRRPPILDQRISLEGTQIIDRDVIFIIKIGQEPIKVKVNMSEL